MAKSHANPVADAAEARAFLEAHPDVRFIDMLFTSMTGVPRGKRLRRDELLAIYEAGRFLPGSILAVDTLGQDCEATGLVWEDGDADRVARPAPGTLVPMTWSPGCAQVLTSLYELDGTPNDLDPRHVLMRVLDRFAADGLTPVVACELEFYLVKAGSDPMATPTLPVSPVSGTTPYGHEVYGMRDLADQEPFLNDVYAACDAQGLPTEAIISEYAPGQLEMGLLHQSDALLAADQAVQYKRAIKAVAVKHGMEVTFMAKPFADQAGNGLHLHVSVLDEDGRNIFAADDPAGTPALRHAIGGMKQLLPESMAIFAPGANSYRRFRANSYAPVAPTWGINNRTVGLRIPAGGPASRHVEHRVSGADANPYLAVAAMLAGVHHGMTQRIDPGPETKGNGYAAADAQGLSLPGNWYKAVDLFEQSAVLADYLGARFQRIYTCVKRTEQDRFYGEVGPLDYAWYLKNA